MSFQLNLAPSVVAKMAKTENDEEGKVEGEEIKETGKKREDWRKLKELEEARKAGTAPAMKDEEGRDINPHIPQYIMQAPWYYNKTQATLNHQRIQEEKKQSFSAMSDWFKKGERRSCSNKIQKGCL